MKIIVVGKGNFAKAFLDQTIDPSIEMIPWDQRPQEYDGVIHTGSGRQLNEVISELDQNHKPLIQAATHLDFPYPEKVDFAWIEAPNLCLFIAKLFYMLDLCGKQFIKFDKTIQESHQQSKTQVSDTAIRFAKSIGLDPAQIESIRDPHKQMEAMHVPEEFLMGHAYHKILIASKGAELSIETKVNGRQSYVEGAIEVTKIWDKLDHKIQPLSDLVQKGLV